MAQDRQGLRLFHARDSCCDVMVRANIALSTGKSAEAIQHYTKVLYKLSPAHACAFLNRSMAYVEEGYYELAVMDAYRAKLAAGTMRKTSQVADRRLSQVARYIKAEQLHIDANDGWTQAGQRNIGKGWARSPLASIVVNATPNDEAPSFKTTRKSIVSALQIRATYRLCGALFMVGDGARKDALDLIEYIKLSMKKDSWESHCFDKLGNEILDQVVSEVDPNDPIAIRLLGSDTKEKRDERMKKLTENMKATTTHYGYGDYPWNPYEPKLGERDWQKRAQAWLEKCSDNCSAVVVHPEGTNGSLAKNPKPHLELRANRDVKIGDLVLSEQTKSNVTTSIPEQIKANRLAGIFDHYYCNSCASLLALLIIPQDFTKKFQEPQSESPPAARTSSALTFSSHNSKNTIQGNSSIGVSATRDSEQPASRHIARFSLAESSPHQAFMFCRPDHIVPTCSSTCRELSEDFDTGICGTNIERKLRQDHFNDLKPRSMTDRKTQCLRDLIFVRHITMAINLGESPLNIKDLVFATSGPNMRGSQITEVDPWSYASHVVRPLRYLDRLFAKTNTDQFFKLSQLDGWMLNTLLSKISRAMRVSKGPRYVKCFRADGTLDIAFGPWDRRWDGLTKTPEGKEDQSIWIAGIDPLFNMIRVADSAKGETPNVAVTHREGVHVFATKVHGRGPAIRTGEPLLRAADGVDSLGFLGDRLYMEGDMSELVEQMGDDDDDYVGDGDSDFDGEDTEVHSGDTSEFLQEFSSDFEDFEDFEDGDGDEDLRGDDDDEYVRGDEDTVDGEAAETD